MASRGGLSILPRMKPVTTPSAVRPAAAASAWAVFAWPAVLWQAPCGPGCRFRHLGTQITSRRTSDALCSGQTVWGDDTHGDAAAAGLAWDWVELGHGIVAMADPMSVITNVRLLGPGGAVLTPMEATPHLNLLVHALPWQEEVQRELERLGH